MCSGNSFLMVFFFTTNFLITTATPKIRRLLVILLPITLPSTISALPLARAFIEIANSGALVPKATIVNPINTLDTLKLVAVDDAPSTKISAPFIKNINPNNNNKIGINIFSPVPFSLSFFRRICIKKMFIFF